MLRKIECFIQPYKLDELKLALIEAGADGMSVTQCQGFGRHHGIAEGDKPEDAPRLLPKTKVEIVVEEDEVEQFISLIKDLARTGSIGAGKIFVLPVEDAIRISTDEVGVSAIR